MSNIISEQLKNLILQSAANNEFIMSAVNEQIGSDAITEFVKDGKMSILKSELLGYFNTRISENPIATAKSFDDYLTDIKTLAAKNPFFVNFDSETDSIITFKFDKLVKVTKANITTPEVQKAIKTFLAYYSRINAGLRPYRITDLFFDPAFNSVRIADVSSVWYNNFKDIGSMDFLPIYEDDTHVTVYCFADEFTTDHQNVLDYMVADGAGDNINITLKMV